MQIRRATPEEAESLSDLAKAAKRYWGYPERWLQHWEQDLTITADFIASNLVFVAEEGDEIRGFYALSLHESHTELEHMWVAPAYIGTVVGKELFLNAMERARKSEVEEIEFASDPNAQGFYERMGAKTSAYDESDIDGEPRRLPHMKISTK